MNQAAGAGSAFVIVQLASAKRCHGAAGLQGQGLPVIFHQHCALPGRLPDKFRISGLTKHLDAS